MIDDIYDALNNKQFYLFRYWKVRSYYIYLDNLYIHTDDFKYRISLTTKPNWLKRLRARNSPATHTEEYKYLDGLIEFDRLGHFTDNTWTVKYGNEWLVISKELHRLLIK